MSVIRTALICGISGQDGALLARLLLRRGYRVVGTSRDAQGRTFSNLKRLGIESQVDLLSMNSSDFRSVLHALQQSKADEVYFLSGQSSVGLSFDEPAETIHSIVTGTLNMLEACRMIDRPIRQYYAGSVECFGDTNGHMATEDTAFKPKSPYGVAKASSIWLVNNYREAYGLYACVGILSNHESALRPQRFVTQKIVQSALEIASGKRSTLTLGRLDINRDWGWAAEYVEAMWLTLQQPIADTYVIATGETNSLEEFVNETFGQVGLDWRDHVTHSDQFLRPTDIHSSILSPKKAEQVLGWTAQSTMSSVAKRMIAGDLS